MIISRWKGFEIDSSEGYYAFERNLEDREEGWSFLRKLLSSPLIWNKVSFALNPSHNHQKEVKDFLVQKVEQGVIEKFEHEFPEEIETERSEYDFTDEEDDHIPSHIPPEFISSLSIFLDILNHLKDLLSLISINFCISPFESLPIGEYKNLHTWFMDQFKNKKKAARLWQFHSQIMEKDFTFQGNTELNNCPESVDPFEGNVELYSGDYCNVRFNIPARDPSLMIYLLITIIDSFNLHFRGNHYTFDDTPDRIKKLKDGHNLSEESIETLRSKN